MKKVIYGIIGVSLFFMGAYILSISSSTSNGQYYSSVSKFKSQTNLSFYNFYVPNSYFDSNLKKQTVKEVDAIKIYYQGSVENSYSMNFEVLDERKDISIIYRVSQYKENETQTDLKDYLSLIKDEKTMYYNINESSISVIYYNENKTEIAINIQYNDPEDKELLKDIAVKIMSDSIQLNESEDKI